MPPLQKSSCAASLDVVDVLRPARLQQRRQRAVGEQPCRRSGSARSSWSRCRRGRCAAPARRTPGTAGRSGRAPPSPGERRDLLGPAAGAPRLAQARDPFGEHVARGRRAGARSSSSVELARQHERREPRAVQDLVGVRVADAAEQARIGERALDACGSRRCSGRANAARVGVITSMPPASSAASAARPATSGATRAACLPASVSSSVPVANSKDASAFLAPAAWRRPRASAGGPRSSGG